MRALILLVATAALFGLIVLPEATVPDDLPAVDRAKQANANRATLAQIYGGLAFFGTLYFAWRGVRTGDKVQVEERFSRAIDQLGATTGNGGRADEKRIGAAYALERIAEDSPPDRVRVAKVLEAYNRMHAPIPTDGSNERRHDVEAVIEALLNVRGRSV